MDVIDDAAYHGLRRAREQLLTMSLNEDTYGPFIKLLEMFVNRSMGPVVQKIERRSLNMHLSAQKPEKEAEKPGKLHEKFQELQSKLTSLPIEAQKVNDPE
jgi:hypothetical protein